MSDLQTTLNNFAKFLGEQNKRKLYDTGWRKITHPKLADGYIVVRRIDDMVYFNIKGGIWDTFRLRDMVEDQRHGNPEGWRLELFQMPVGFRPDAAQGASLYQDFYKEIAVCMISSKTDSGATLQFRNKTMPDPKDNKDLRIQEIKFLTTDPMPSEAAINSVGVELSPTKYGKRR